MENGTYYTRRRGGRVITREELIARGKSAHGLQVWYQPPNALNRRLRFFDLKKGQDFLTAAEFEALDKSTPDMPGAVVVPLAEPSIYTS